MRGNLEHDPEKWKPFSEKIMLKQKVSEACLGNERAAGRDGRRAKRAR
jgi:hypothetical protein